jgi:hypothetical protein
MVQRILRWWFVLRWSLARILRCPPAMGFVYASTGESGPMGRADTGSTIRGASSGPPWIAVSRTLDDVIVARWPGRLWRVELLEAAPSQPRQSAGHTRAIAVKVLEELSAATLFGAHGAEVSKVIQAAERLTEEDVERLRARASEAAVAAYARAWTTWITQKDPTSHFVQREHEDTLQARVAGKTSPIGHGLSIVYKTVFERARAVGGDEVVVRGEDEVWLVPRWATAADALCQAALALGAPEVMPEADRILLLSAFVEACGPLR